MHQSKLDSTPLGHHTKLSITQAPSTDEEKSKIGSIPYASGVRRIMYGMVCSKLDLALVVSIISHFMENSGQAHSEALK